MVRYLICNTEGRSSIFSIIHHTSTEGHSKKEASACITLVLGNCLQVTARLGLLSKGRPCDIQSQTSRELLPGCTVYIVADGKKVALQKLDRSRREGGITPAIRRRPPSHHRRAKPSRGEAGILLAIRRRPPSHHRCPKPSGGEAFLP